MILLEAVGQRKQHPEDVFDHRPGTVMANVGDADAMLFGAVRVDVVGARRCERDELQFRCALQQLARQTDLVGENDLCIADALRDGVPR